jgi:hypothetical protein
MHWYYFGVAVSVVLILDIGNMNTQYHRHALFKYLSNYQIKNFTKVSHNTVRRLSRSMEIDINTKTDRK